MLRKCAMLLRIKGVSRFKALLRLQRLLRGEGLVMLRSLVTFESLRDLLKLGPLLSFEDWLSLERRVERLLMLVHQVGWRVTSGVTERIARDRLGARSGGLHRKGCHSGG